MPTTTNNQTPLDPRSETNLKTLVPSAQLQARAFMLAVNVASWLPKAWCFKITSATRDDDEQNALYAQGRTAPGKIVTYARAGQSNHNYEIAWDITLFDANGQPVWDSPLYAKAGALGRSLGLEWGGDWAGKKKDEPHFQCKTGKSVGELRALVEAKGTLEKAAPAIDALVKANAPVPTTPPAPKWKIGVQGVAFSNFFEKQNEAKENEVWVYARGFVLALRGESYFDEAGHALGFNKATGFLTLGGHDLNGTGGGPKVNAVLQNGDAFAPIRVLATAFGGTVKADGQIITVTRNEPTG